MAQVATVSSTHAVLNPNNARHLLACAIKNKRNVLLTGAPGIGKTDVVTQAAADAGADLVLTHPAVAEPTDYKGLPWKNEGDAFATFLPFGDLQRLLQATTLTVCFIDDLGQGQPSVQAAIMQLLHSSTGRRQLNNQRIPDCVVFIAATNRRQDRAGVTGLLEPVKSRFATIVELRTEFEDWKQWAYAHDVHPLVIAFVSTNRALLHEFQPSQDIANSPSPRTWKHASDWVHDWSRGDLPRECLLATLCGSVGDGAGSDLHTFIDLAHEAPDIDDILASPETAPIPDKQSVLYAVVSSLVSISKDSNFDAIIEYGLRLDRVKRGDFAALLICDCQRRHPTFTKAAAYAKYAASPLARSIIGARTI